MGNRLKNIVNSLKSKFSHAESYTKPEMPISLDTQINKDLEETRTRLEKALKRALNPPKFKPYSSYGFRGTPRRVVTGFVPAPSLDKVRSMERKYGCRFHVKEGGKIYFRNGPEFSEELGNEILANKA